MSTDEPSVGEYGQLQAANIRLQAEVQQMKKLMQEQREVMEKHLGDAREMHRQNNEYRALFDEIVRSVASLRRDQA